MEERGVLGGTGRALASVRLVWWDSVGMSFPLRRPERLLAKSHPCNRHETLVSSFRIQPSDLYFRQAVDGDFKFFALQDSKAFARKNGIPYVRVKVFRDCDIEIPLKNDATDEQLWCCERNRPSRRDRALRFRDLTDRKSLTLRIPGIEFQRTGRMFGFDSASLGGVFGFTVTHRL